MQSRREEEKQRSECMRNHLGQEVRRLSSYAFQNERSFSVQIGVLWVKRIKKESRQNKEKSVPDDSQRLVILIAGVFDFFLCVKRSVEAREGSINGALSRCGCH